MKKVILFDIDGTLVHTGGAGGRAMLRAFAEFFELGDRLGPMSVAGRTDYWIVAEMARRHGIDFSPGALGSFKTSYVSHLEKEMHMPGPGKGVMPGVTRLLDALEARDDVHLGLLTGNFEAGARIKLGYFDLWRYFPFGAFGDKTPDRNALLEVALARVETGGGPSASRDDVTIVGDTPLDVEVAKAGGARSLAVATGSYEADPLRASGADVVLDDLGDLIAVLDALGLNAPARDGRTEANGARWPSRSSKSVAPR